MLISDTKHILLLSERHPEAFAAQPDWPSFCQAIGMESAADSPWAAQSYLTLKHRPEIGNGHALAFPKARSMADLFEAAIFSPSYSGPGDKIMGTPLAHVPEFFFVGGSRSGSAAPSDHVKGKRYVKLFPDGTVVRGRSGGQFYVTKAKPRAEVLEAIEARAFVNGLASFEVVKRGDGFLLVIARGGNSMGDYWLALLDPDESLVPLMPEEDQELLSAEAQADRDAWSCIYKGEDGREYLDKDACRVEIRT